MKQYLAFEAEDADLVDPAENTEVLLPKFRFNDKPVYRKVLPLFLGPNGTPGVPAQVQQAHGIASIDWAGWLQIGGTIHPVGGGWAIPNTSNDLVFGVNITFIAGATNCSWRANYNATALYNRIILEYQKP
jgi:hypothetical protein